MTETREVYFDDPRCRMVFAFYGERVFLHINVRQWTRELCAKIRAEWPKIKTLLKERGYAKINAFCEIGNARTPLFASRFGFRELRRNGSFILMEVDNA